MKIVEQSGVSVDRPEQDLRSLFGEALEFNKPLAPLSTFETGGKAKYFISCQTPENVTKTLQAVHSLKLPYVVIGGGSNLLISDDGYDGLVVKIDLKGMKMLSPTEIECMAGEELMSLVRFAADNGLTGIEFASGIFGYVGGAIYGNAGAYGGEMKDILKEINLVSREGELKTVTPEYCRFGYRDSYLKKSKDIVLSAIFSLSTGDKEEITRKIDDILRIRSGKHPVDGRSAGSFFKNIPDPSQPYGKLPAGKLLEECGVKGLQVGGAKVFDKHANMIVNTGTATSKDIRQLADIMKQKVLDKFDIELEEEVISIGIF